MKRVLFVLLALTAYITINAQDATPPQSWTASDGRVIEAKFIKLDGESVVIEKDGTQFAVPFAKLNAQSVVQAKKLGMTTTTGTTTLNGDKTLMAVSKDAPFVNSLGMKFVPVPGTQIMICIHETRNKDYAAYAAENSGVDSEWKNVSFELTNGEYTLNGDSDNPVVNVSWEDATAFCNWLGSKDGYTCRLPTDHEWSCAVGIGGQENPRDTPEAKSCKVPGFPWGAGYPPPRDHVGNYRDSTVVKKGETENTDLGSYNDGNFLTAQVMTYPTNELGIFDLGGNVWEWCQDLYQPDKNYRVLRGGSWDHYDRELLASSSRFNSFPNIRFSNFGFRCVVFVGRSSP